MLIGNMKELIELQSRNPRAAPNQTTEWLLKLIVWEIFCTLTWDSRARSCVRKRRCRAASQPAEGVHSQRDYLADARATGLWKSTRHNLLSVLMFSEGVGKLSVCRGK